MTSDARPFHEAGWLARNGPKVLEQLLRVLVFRSSSCLLILDDDCVCKVVSGGAARIFGLPGFRMIGQSLQILASDPTIDKSWLRTLLASPSDEGALVVRGRDGISQHFFCIVKPNLLPGRHAIAITHRSYPEQAGGSSVPQEKQHPAPVIDFACYLLDENARFVQWSQGAERTFGHTVDEVAGLPLSLLYPEEESLNEQSRLLDRVAAEDTVVLEKWNIRKDGSRFWASVLIAALKNEAGELMGFAGIVRDFNDRRELAPRAGGYRTTVNLEQKVAGIAWGDFDQIRDANDALLQLIGYSREDLAEGRLDWSNLIPPEFAMLDDLAHEEELLSRACTPYATECLTKQGTRVDVLVTTAVLNLVPFQWITVIQDLGARAYGVEFDEVESGAGFEEMVGSSAALRRIQRQVEVVAPTTANVLILGETGTGKELVARAIHQMSPRRDFPFVTLNCAAIPTGLLESELFGYERGAFTGALAQKIGRFETAHRGTLFLDEVGDIPLELQPKLLRALQDKSFERLGGVRTIPIDVRLVAATNRNLTEMMGDKLFRSDLYYRLNVFPISMPPLRERPEDIPPLVRHFIKKYGQRMARKIEKVPAETMAAMVRWHWPGNIRELENFVERSVILSAGTTLRSPLDEIRKPAAPGPIGTLESVERDHILRALRESKGVVTLAATRLGLHRTTLNAMMRKLGISRKDI